MKGENDEERMWMHIEKMLYVLLLLKNEMINIKNMNGK